MEQMTPFELLDGYEDAVRRKGPRAGRRWCAKWREYEATMKGRRCIFWSKGLRERFALDPELTDEEIVAEVGQEGASVIATLYPDEWRIIVVQRMRAQLLDAAERRGAEGVAVFMEAAWRRWWSMEVRDDDPPEPVYDDDMVELGLAEGWWD